MRFLPRYICVALALGATIQSVLADSDTLPSGQAVAPLDSFQECYVCPEMIVLPMGGFTMGASLETTNAMLKGSEKWGTDHPLWFERERPVHEVDIDIPMGRNELSRAEWFACIDSGFCTHTPDSKVLPARGAFASDASQGTGGYADDPRYPVMNVNFTDIREFLAWLNAKAGADVYRLPTEAEWEYAARAGTTTHFAQGETLTDKQANFATAYSPILYPVFVDKLDAANGWGLRHMPGNANERTMSCYHDRHLGLSTSFAYLAETRKPSGCAQVLKGGSFASNLFVLRPAHRWRTERSARGWKTGFRIVREMY